MVLLLMVERPCVSVPMKSGKGKLLCGELERGKGGEANKGPSLLVRRDVEVGVDLAVIDLT